MKRKLLILSMLLNCYAMAQYNLEFKAGFQIPSFQTQIQTQIQTNSIDQSSYRLGPYYEGRIELNISPLFEVSKYFEIHKNVVPFIGLGYTNTSKKISYLDPIYDSNGAIIGYGTDEKSYKFINHYLFLDAGLKFQKEVGDFSLFITYNNRFDYIFAAENSYYFNPESSSMPFSKFNVSQVFGIGFEFIKPKFKPSVQVQYCHGITNSVEKTLFNIQNNFFQRSWILTFAIRI